ncbi:hypothetical protein Mapa_009619 [Marchantia paleacea]|nr:hypothetical protein Mapa_009619 [Marchantia paleacea]
MSFASPLTHLCSDFVSWEMGSPLTFHGPGDKKAVQDGKTTSQLTHLCSDFVSWEMGSPLTFHGPGDKKAVQDGKTTSQSGVSSVYTFCLEKVVNGVYKGCWMIVGFRVRDYANV